MSKTKVRKAGKGKGRRLSARKKGASARGKAGRGPADRTRLREIGGLALGAAGLFMALVLYLGWGGGIAGEAADSALRYLFGVLVYMSPPALLLTGAWLIFPEIPLGPRGLKAGVGFLIAGLFLITGANTLSVLGADPVHERFFDSAYFPSHGGIVGDALYWATGSLVGDVGASVAVLFLLLASAFLITGASVRTVLVASGKGARRAAASARKTSQQVGHTIGQRRGQNAAGGALAAGAGGAAGGVQSVPFGVDAEAAAERPSVGDSLMVGDGGQTPLDGANTYPDIFEKGPEDGRPALSLVENDAARGAQVLELPVKGTAPGTAGHVAGKAGNAGVRKTGKPGKGATLEPVQDELFPRTKEEEETGYILPNPDLLKKSAAGGEAATDGAERISRVLVETLQSFGIEARVAGTVSGPRVTRYELQLAPGIKVSKVSNLKNDIAYALATTDIRILAPIPGKSAVGVEVPNASPNLVTLGDIYRDFPAGSGPLMVWLGKDIAGKAVYTDLAQMPHLLVAGTTGSGKSGCINCIVSSVLLHSSPDEVNMVLVDPKRVELNHFEGIPHLLTPVVTVMKDAANVLANLVEEMESRYGQMQLVKARHLDELNRVREERGQRKLPYVLLVVDELADLMMVAPGEVEDAIIRLAQKSRAVGIHLVLATQRPSVDVITGMIKANVPSRIAFAVSSQIDSRVILDTTGAESLLGQGDMLFSPLGSSQLQRIQGAYVSEEEIKLLTDRCKIQKSPDFNLELLEGKAPDDDEKLPADEDDLLVEAMQLVVSSGTASVSFLQRRLRVGYTRAGRLIDMLEKRGVISGYEGSKPRRVLMTEGDLDRLLAHAGARSASGSASAPGGAGDAASSPADGYGIDDEPDYEAADNARDDYVSPDFDDPDD